MQQAVQGGFGQVVAFPAVAAREPGPFSPQTVADDLRRFDPIRARGFAMAMHANAAWANEAWGKFWADVVVLV